MMSLVSFLVVFFFVPSRRRHTRCSRDWSSDVCSSDLLIGINASEEPAVDRVGPLMALREGTACSRRIAWLTLESVYKLLAWQVSLKTLGGPIMIAQVAGKQAEQGASYLIHFMAVLSVNRALLNLLPIPILDGGHLFFLFWEAVRGQPVAIKHREIAQALGLMLLLALIVL